MRRVTKGGEEGMPRGTKGGRFEPLPMLSCTIKVGLGGGGIIGALSGPDCMSDSKGDGSEAMWGRG